MAYRNALALALLAALAVTRPASAQMVTGRDMPGYGAAFGLLPSQIAKSLEVRQVGVSVGDSEGANVLWPGEQAKFTLRFTNKASSAVAVVGRVELIRYATSVQTGDVWVPHVRKLADCGQTPLKLDIPGKGQTEVTIEPKVPEEFGGYALIADLGDQGRLFCAALVRALKPDPGRVQYPTYALDLPWPHEMSEAVTTLFERLGVKGCRMGAAYLPTTFGNYDAYYKPFIEHLNWAHKHSITVMLTIGGSGAGMPLNRPRPWLSPDDVMLDTKSDYAWLPEFDPDFRVWTKRWIGTYGWPKGPVNAVELWNEPWEGISISGWGADMIRYRDMYRQMAMGVEDARREDGVQVLIGGACSSTNTRDKFFADGSDELLKWLDFVSIHYQPLAADPALEKAWLNRKHPNGPVRVWDTESWVANSEDRVAAVIASMRAQGQSRTAGIYHGNVYTPEVLTDNPRVGICQAWAPAAAIAASQKFIGQRPFIEILFKNGLPWVFVFAESGAKRDDGTLVIVGDLGGVYERNRVKFRRITGLKNLPRVAEARKALEALPAHAPESQRKQLTDRLAAAMVTDGATMTIAAAARRFRMYDFYGNPVAADGGKIVVPLNGLGYFLRTDGSPGSFDALLKAVAAARVDGLMPVEIVAQDMIAPIASKPAVRLAVTNVLNRPVQGTLSLSLGKLTLEQPVRPISLQPHQTLAVVSKVASGSPSPDNAYPLRAVFDAGLDGRTEHEETLRVNVLDRRAVTVDGKLDDWRDALPYTVTAAAGIGTSLTERAYLPFMPFEQGATGGMATAYTAYDERYFYFAAKLADATPWPGGVRYETRDDDAYFYPAKCYTREDRKELVWPAGVRRFSYRKDPDLPSGNGTDNVQLAFNVLPPEEKPWLPYPPGTMPGFMTYMDTDYEFALNQVAEQYGGGTEIWRLAAPGIPRKHYYPRQPKAPVDGGPVKNGKLAMRREGNMRIVEAALPWSEIPHVKKRVDAGLTIKFTFRVNDNAGPALELAGGRSVSREGMPTFHNDWTSHWANELEFGILR
ncbi:MAG: hypothetical protein GX446_00155 [Chthonomonadales bacterium]|nr:hypothetical protein [Chthonomonadales bacterium]